MARNALVKTQRVQRARRRTCRVTLPSETLGKTKPKMKALRQKTTVPSELGEKAGEKGKATTVLQTRSFEHVALARLFTHA